MAEILVTFHAPVPAPDGSHYVARARGEQRADGLWEGWIEFEEVARGLTCRTARETTQPNRTDAEYWATGLTPVYLEGALARALGDAASRGHAARSVTAGADVHSVPVSPGGDSVLNPFSVYRKGETLLRQQLGALASWHLVNIILDYHLSDAPTDALTRRSPAQLVEVIVAAVKGNPERAA